MSLHSNATLEAMPQILEGPDRTLRFDLLEASPGPPASRGYQAQTASILESETLAAGTVAHRLWIVEMEPLPFQPIAEIQG